jgi:predicted metal-dependent phosphoesterase TrpH
MIVDLHSHTYYSDGSLSPEQLVMRAHTMQVDVLAITDHDTLAAIAPAQAFQQRQSRALTIIPGVEISTSWHGFEIHVLALHVDPNHPQLVDQMTSQQQKRLDRAKKISDKLQQLGISGVLERAQCLVNKDKQGITAQITRAHIAQALLDMGKVSRKQQAFDKYLGKGKDAYVKADWMDMPSAIECCHAAGGRAVLAHPGHYDLTAKWLRKLVAEFSAAGGDGMELTHAQLSPQKQQLLNQLAVEHHLLASAGSDFHQPSRWRELGRKLHLTPEIKPVWYDWF